MHPFNTTILRSAMAGLALVAGVTTVSAQTTEPRTALVTYGDLDLSSPAGVDRLNTRVRSAAKRVCAVDSGVPLSKATGLRNACLKTALADADKSVQLAIANHSNQQYASRDSGKGIMVGSR